MLGTGTPTVALRGSRHDLQPSQGGGRDHQLFGGRSVFLRKALPAYPLSIPTTALCRGRNRHQTDSSGLSAVHPDRVTDQRQRIDAELLIGLTVVLTSKCENTLCRSGCRTFGV